MLVLFLFENFFIAIALHALVDNQLHVTGKIWCETWVWLPSKFVRIDYEPSIKAL